MSGLEIPDVAYAVAYVVASDKFSSRDEYHEAMINAAAPLIVAAELRRMAVEWEDSYPFERATRLHDRANELDPQQ
jgi:hypothetical protein